MSNGSARNDTVMYHKLIFHQVFMQRAIEMIIYTGEKAKLGDGPDLGKGQTVTMVKDAT